MDIEERFARLERQNRNLKKGIILAVVFIGGFFGLGQMSPAPSVIKAKEFIVTGDNGQVLASMGANYKGTGGVVAIFNTKGKPVAKMRGDSKGTDSLWISNAEVVGVALMGVDSEGDGIVKTRDANGVWESL